MATVVEFRTGVADKLGYAARWLRMAAARGVRVRVLGDAADLQWLDRALWVDEPGDFVPHLRTARGAAPAAAGMQRTLLWLGDGVLAGAEPPLLLNLGADPESAPRPVGGYERIVEIVSDDADDVRQGRQRWATYKRLGLWPQHRQGEGSA